MSICSALHIACLRGHVAIVQFLLSNGASADLPTRDNANETALDIATRLKHQDIVDILTSGHSPVPPPAMEIQTKDSDPPASSAAAGGGGGGGGGGGEDCIICMERPSATVFLNCGHMSCCVECSTSITAKPNSLCPICRTEIVRFVRVFKAGV